MASRRDFFLVIIIGAAVGLLAQPILGNFAASLHDVLPVPFGVARAITFIFFVLLAPFALAVAAFLGRTVAPVLYQFAKFAAVGALNSFVDLGIFNLETALLGTIPGTALFSVFKAISFLAATTNSFFWNKYWTFESSGGPRLGEAAKFYGIAITGGLLNVGVATAVQAAAPASVAANLWTNIIAPLAGIFAALLWNFVGYKFFVFKKRVAIDISSQGR